MSITKKGSLYFVDRVNNWPIPKDLSDYKSYGLWNSLSVYDHAGRLLDVISAHDGDFFPESPLDYVEIIRKAVSSKKNEDHVFWPLRVDIDITQTCTDNCSFCYSRLYRFDPLYQDAEISVSVFATLLKKLSEKGTRSVRFTGGGDPLTHPEIRKMLPMPRYYGLRSCLITNGDLLDRAICELLVSNVDHVRVSLNAAQNDTRQSVHKPRYSVNDLSTILEFIGYMAQLRDRMWPLQRKPLIWTTFLLIPENIDEIFLAAQNVRDCGADSISFRPVYHNLLSPFSKSELDTLQHQLKLASSLHSPPSFQVLSPKRDVTKIWQISPQNQFSKCISCRARTIVEATNLGPMIKVCDIQRGMHGERMGVAGESLGLIKNKTPFSKLWNSHNTKRILSHRPETCGEHCIAFSMNITLNKVWGILIEHPEATFRKSWNRTSLHPAV